MTNLDEHITRVLHHHADDTAIENNLDAIFNNDHIIRFTPQRDNRGRRPLLLTAAAATMLVVGAGGLIWAQRSEPVPPAAANSPQAAVPATFPRLQFAAPDARSGPMLVGAQDYPIEDGWFSFANYDQDVDLESNGTLTRIPAFSVATFTATQADLGRAICGSPVDVVQGDRAITVSERSPGQLRFVWNEAPGVLVVVDTSLSNEAALAAIETLQPIDEDVWQQGLDAVPAPEVVRDASDRDAIWADYVGPASTDEQLDPPPTTSPGLNSC